MFFWFTNDTFSIIDALMKLILVITGSALIICFCHKLTNYKKSRRYKSNSLTNINQHDLDRVIYQPAGSVLNANPGNTSVNRTNGTLLQAVTYDPYNTLRPFDCLNQPELTGLNNSSLANAYGYHHSVSPFYNTQQQAFNHQAPLSINGGNNSTSATQQIHQTTLIANPIYSTNLTQPGDCSSFRAQLIEQPPEQDVCPSYEEAIAASNNLTLTSNIIHNSNSNSSNNNNSEQPGDRQQQLDGSSSLTSKTGELRGTLPSDLYQQPRIVGDADQEQPQTESQTSLSSPVIEQEQKENDFIVDQANVE